MESELRGRCEKCKKVNGEYKFGAMSDWFLCPICEKIFDSETVEMARMRLLRGSLK